MQHAMWRLQDGDASGHCLQHQHAIWWLRRQGGAVGLAPCLQRAVWWLRTAKAGWQVGFACSMPCGCGEDGEASGPCLQRAMPGLMAAKYGRPGGLCLQATRWWLRRRRLCLQHAMWWLRRQGDAAGLASCLQHAMWWLRRRDGKWALSAICHVSAKCGEDGEASGHCLQRAMPGLMAAKYGRPVGLCLQAAMWWLRRRWLCLQHAMWWLRRQGEASGPCLKHTMPWLMAGKTGRPVGLACNMPCHGCEDGRPVGFACNMPCHVMAATTGRPVGLAHNMPWHG